jgi:hypothetical protein
MADLNRQRIVKRCLSLLAATLCLVTLAMPQAQACSVVRPARSAVFEGVLLKLQPTEGPETSTLNSRSTENTSAESWTATFQVKVWRAGTSLKKRSKRVTVTFSRYFEPTEQADLNDGTCEDNAIKFDFRLRSTYRVRAFWNGGSEAALFTGAYFAPQPFAAVS